MQPPMNVYGLNAVNRSQSVWEKYFKAFLSIGSLTPLSPTLGMGAALMTTGGGPGTPASNSKPLLQRWHSTNVAFFGIVVSPKKQHMSTVIFSQTLQESSAIWRKQRRRLVSNLNRFPNAMVQAKASQTRFSTAAQMVSSIPACGIRKARALFAFVLQW